LAAGGVPPFGTDFNGVLNDITSAIRWGQAGGGYPFSSSFNTLIAGYPKGARVPNSTLDGFWLNTTDGNTANPENTTSALTGWVPSGSYGVTAITGLAGSSVTLTTLQASKDRITLAGALTSNINIVVPAWLKRWEIINNTTGSFSVTIKTPSGTGVSIASGSNANVVGDGVNISNSFSPGSLIGTQTFTSSGTYSPTPGTKSVVVEVQAAGGGSGGIGSAGSSTVSMGNGGAGGGYAKSRLTTGFSGGIPITVGLGGSGGNLAPTNGSDGGLSSFGSLIVANGGRGGISQAQVAPTFSATGSLGGVATGGNLLNIRGGASTNGACLSTTSVLPGNGGGSQLGSGGLSPANNTTTVYGGEGYGGGGGGGYAFNRSGNSGSEGANGVVIIWEYA
jgi:hypothetical protein